MSKYKLTVAMCEYMDHSGTFFTVQSLRMHQDMEDCEIIVLDNAPNSPDGEATKGFIANAGNQPWCPVRYVPFSENTGTTQTRQRLFDLAEGEYVLVMDDHVLLQANAIHNLKKFFDSADADMKKNLFTGPLLMDNLGHVQTHFECEWRSEMWGTWATAWRNPDGQYLVGRPSIQHDPINSVLEMKLLNTDGPYVPTDIKWVAHEQALYHLGWKIAGYGEDTTPFEVPGQGLGLFCSSKEHWLGFNKDFRSFGGEECYIHTKYRQAGRKTMCLPFLKWNHRFGRPGGPKYPITVEGKMRNYILGFNELGMDLKPVRHHFVDEVGVTPAVWDYAVKDPVNFDPFNNPYRRAVANTGIVGEYRPEGKSNLGLRLPVVEDSLQTVAVFLQTYERDLDKHGQTLIDLASDCQHVVEFTKRRESTAFLLAGITRRKPCQQEVCRKEGCQGPCKAPVRFISFQEERDTLIDMLHAILPQDTGKPCTFSDTPVSHDTMQPLETETDMVFIDTRHTGSRAAAELKAYAPMVRKYIVFHDTNIYGMVGEDGQPGLLMAIKDFIRENPEWYVLSHTNEQYGLTVLSRVPDKRPQEKVRPWPRTVGVGTSVKAGLAKLGINPSATCSCNAKAAEWDHMGPAWCRENIESMVDFLHEQYKAQKVWETKGIPFVRIAVKWFVKACIRDAEHKIAQGLDE